MPPEVEIVKTERLDDIPLLLAQMEKMNVQGVSQLEKLKRSEISQWRSKIKLADPNTATSGELSC